MIKAFRVDINRVREIPTARYRSLATGSKGRTIDRFEWRQVAQLLGLAP